MTVIEFLVLLLVAGICGAVAQAITGFTRGGCLTSVGVGFIGALLGMWLARQLGFGEMFVVRIGTVSFPIVWSMIGATLFVTLVGLLTRRAV